MKNRFFALILVVALVLNILSRPVYSASINNTDHYTERYTVLVLDCSGSMSGEPMKALKESANKFCDSLFQSGGNNYISIITYSTNVGKWIDFTDNKTDLKNMINSMAASGDTNMEEGLQKAKQLLVSLPDDSIKNLVIMSDGLPQHGKTSEEGPFTSSSSSLYKYANAVYNVTNPLLDDYNVYSLGFFHSLSSSNLNFARSFMETIQNKGYFDVNDPSELSFVFGEISDAIITGSLRAAYINQHINYFQSSDYKDSILMGFSPYMKEVFNDIDGDWEVNGFNALKFTNDILDLNNPLKDDEELYEFLLLQLMMQDQSLQGMEKKLEENYLDNLVSCFDAYAKFLQEKELIPATSKELKELVQAVNKVVNAKPLETSNLDVLLDDLYDKAIQLPDIKEDDFFDYLMGYTNERGDFSTVPVMNSFISYAVLHGINEVAATTADIINGLAYGSAFLEVSQSYIEYMRQFAVTLLYEEKGLSDDFIEIGVINSVKEYSTLCDAFINVTASMNKYKEKHAFKFALSIIDDHALGYTVDVGKKIGVDFVEGLISLTPVGRALLIGKSVLQVTEMILSFSSISDRDYNADLVKKLYMINVINKQVSDTFGHSLESKKTFEDAANFDEAVYMYKTVGIMAADSAIKYETLRLQNVVNNTSPLYFNKQQDASWFSTAISLAALDKMIKESIHCHSEGLIYDHKSPIRYDNKKYKVICIACPVSVVVKNASGKQVALLSDQNTLIEEGYEPYFHILQTNRPGDYMKFMLVPEDYKISMTGTAAGSMNVLISTYEDGKILDTQYFHEVNVTKGTEYSLKEDSNDNDLRVIHYPGGDVSTTKGSRNHVDVEKKEYFVAAGQKLYAKCRIETAADYKEGSHKYIGYFAYLNNNSWEQLNAWYIDGGLSNCTVSCDVSEDSTPGQRVKMTVSIFPADRFSTGNSLYDKFFYINILDPYYNLLLNPGKGSFSQKSVSMNDDIYGDRVWDKDADGNMKGKITYDLAYGNLPVPERNGYDFAGWYTEENGQGESVTDKSIVDIMGDQILYAYWKPQCYMIQLNANGGELFTDRAYVMNGGEYSFVDNIEPESSEGLIFAGWFSKQNGGEQVTSSTKFTNSSPKTLYAHWKKDISKEKPVITSITNTSNGIKLTWNACPDAEQFIVWYGRDGIDFSDIAYLSLSYGTSFTDTIGLSNGYKYYYKVSAVYPDGEEVSDAVDIYRLSKTSFTSVKNNKKNTVTLKWKINKKASGYQIQVAQNPNFSKDTKSYTISSYRTISKTVKSLKKKKTYYFRVRCLKSYNSKKCYSAWSSVKKLKIKK